jgi:hypothetical protein
MIKKAIKGLKLFLEVKELADKKLQSSEKWKTQKGQTRTKKQK